MSLTTELQRNLRRDAATKFARAVRIVDDRLDTRTPVRTGKLKRSRRTRLSTSGTAYTATIDFSARTPSGADYGQMLDDGLRPHVIRARRAKALRFVIGGEVLYRRQVNWRPGAGARRARGWFSRSTSKADWRLVLDQVFR